MEKIEFDDGDFIILNNKLGEGSFGEVYDGTYTDQEETVRVIVKHFVSFEYGEIEANVAKIVACNNIKLLCILFDFTNTEDNSYYVVYRYAENAKDLEVIIQDRRAEEWDENKLIRIMYDMCEALNDFHKLGLVHRDIKPANILIMNDDIPIIIDYNLSCLQPCGSGAGTPIYIAPEMWEGLDYDEKVDIFSLGATFYELLTNRRMVEDVPGMRTRDVIVVGLFNNLHDTPLLNEHNLKTMKRIVDGMTNKEPSRRMTLQECMYRLKGMLYGNSATFVQRMWRRTKKMFKGIFR